MAGETIITVVGNLTADPELRYTQGGLAVANFTIASTPRTFDRQANDWKDGEALFLRASVWREFAENVAGTLTKGSRVIATGRLKQRSYETKEGEKRTSIELEIDEIGPSLRYATAQVTRTSGGGGRGQAGGGQSNGGQIGGGQGGSGGGNQGGSGNVGGNRGGQAEEPWAPSAPAGGDVWSTPGSYNDETPF
ncbi:single-stranded DNA-binding protein [Rathayibacter iranicus]|uniref:Single-stranded DNA-binding protein n=2 Tax=Rathayibacter iranicus TaxID=59737 RepID=A0AAD1AG19_9MICO|nr:single-stranded DNA-binding protein [Rathayibacter iranicus]AZZ56560.1 single-stranded DNA-binding protein [Rathayibacter iranicus]MWV31893.1 single-stranded DNA-binding protein [Rathayibacter iranicus NCPPB 2253 = VKM Ac-1602]PPI43665.1 single-stranded DNA-binding protein [Rathayibacter iranicus]PPI58822.1 single-stranded DNA-binding protein [Rathayibacter iranicus]PPI69807.1 single-stranded DNA-binding protein [Rathayibacter iranicus]